MPVQPLPCGAGSGDPGLDVEGSLICDVDAEGNVIGVALVEAVYDAETGIRTGTRLVNPVDGSDYVPQGTMQPCHEGCCPEPLVLCDIQADGSSTEFLRTYRGQEDGGVTAVDQLLDGSPYTPTGTVGACQPTRLCYPSTAQDLNAECGPAETADQDLINSGDATVTDDTTADVLCDGGVWVVDPVPYPAPFPINEPLTGNATNDPDVTFFDDAQLTGNNVIDPVGSGWLRLTNNASASRGAIIFNSAFPASESVTIEFDYAIYGGDGADGIVVFLLDGTQPSPVALGGGGGALGYASLGPPFPAAPGIADGILGVGLHEYPSYATTPGVGTGGVPFAQGSHSITLRGRGDGGVGGDGQYAYITNQQVTPQTIDGHPRSAPVHVKMTLLSEGGSVFATVSLDFNDGNGPTTYIDRFDATAQTAPLPVSYRLGFSGGTGAAHHFHEIRNLRTTPAGRQNWRAFPIEADTPPDCATQLRVTASVDVTFTSDDQTETAGNADPEAYLWLVNTATNTVVARDELTSRQSRVGDVQSLTVTTLIPVTDLANLRAYVGAESRDQAGSYGHAWENFDLDVEAIGCPAQGVRTVPVSAPCPLDVRVIGGSSDGDSVPVTVVNTPATFEDAEVCATVDGTPNQRLFRREVRSPDGTNTVQFLTVDGALVTPDTWTPGACCCEDCPQILGEVCYTPPNAAQPLTDDWTGATSQVIPGGRIWTNSDFAGEGATVTQTVSPASNLQAGSVFYNVVGASTRSVTIDLGAPRTNVIIQFDAFGATGGETLRNISPAFTSLTGNGVASLSNTRIDGGPAGDGSLFVRFDGPVQTITYDVVTAGASGVLQSFITYDATTPAQFSRATRIRNCDGTASLVDLRTGATIDPDTVSIIDCPCCENTVTLGPVCYALNATPAVIVHGFLVRNQDGTISLYDQTGTLVSDPYTIADCPLTELDPPALDVELVCASFGGTNVPAFRREVIDAEGTTTVTFLSVDGVTFVPDAWTPGPCDPRDVETYVLCDFTDPDNPVPFLRQVNYLANGDASTDMQLDGVTPYGTQVLDARPCPDGCGTTVLKQLCDSNGPFLRRFTFDCDGVVAGTANLTLAGAPYVPVGTVAVCEEPCRNTTTLLLCDVPTTGVETTPTVTDTDPSPYHSIQGEYSRTGGSAAIWAGGPMPIAADNAAPPDGFTQYVRTGAGLVQAAAPCCDDGTAQLTVDFDVTRTGPQAACQNPGNVALRLGAAVLDAQALTVDYPVGLSTHIQLQATVSTTDLVAGNIAVVYRLETWQNSAACGGVRSGGWTLANFEAAVTFDVDDCSTQFLRHVTVDCETGTVVDTADTTLEGNPYTPSCGVAQCTTNGSTTSLGDDSEIVQLCDDNGTFLRRFLFDSTGNLLGSLDLNLAGDPYVPVGTVTYGCTDPTATAQIIRTCEDVPTQQFATGPNLLQNGDFGQSTGSGATSVAGPGWVSSYTACGPNLFAGPCGAATWAYFTSNAGQVTGGNAAATPIEALGPRSMAVNVGPSLTVPIIEWQNVYLVNGQTYELSADAAVIIAPYDVALKIGGSAAPGGLFPLSTPPTSNWGKTTAVFTYTGTTGYTSVGLYSNNNAAAGNDHAFDNFSLHTITEATAGVTTPTVYSGTQRAVIEQIVETAGCNDDRRDALLGHIADAITPRLEAQLDATVQRQTGAGTVTIATGARSVTLIVLTGPVTVNLGQGVQTIPTGVTLTWSVDGPGEALAEALAFTGVAGSDFIVTSTRQ